MRSYLNSLKSLKDCWNLNGDVKILSGVYDGGAVEIGIRAINIGTTGMFRIAYPEAIFDKEIL